MTEWMAFEQIEPFGGLVDERRMGMVCAVQANLQRGPKDDARQPWDFSPALREEVGISDEPLLLADPKKQAEMIRQALGGGT